MEALRQQISIAAHIACAASMLASVKLDDQPPRSTEKIDDVMVNWDLLLELEGSEALGAHDLPQAMFGLSRSGSHGLSAAP